MKRPAVGVRFGAAVVAGIGVAFVVTGLAFAFWTTTGSGGASASATTLTAPTGVAGTSAGSSVTVSFTGVTPPAGTLTGYYVTRYLGAVPSNACGTVPGTPATYLAPAATGCTDTSVSSGTYTYRVTAVFHTWSTQSAASAPVVVTTDSTPPTQVVSLTAATGASLTGTTVFYRSGSAGSFAIADAVTDSGSGPASASFPAIATSGWTHGAQTVSSGTGSAPTITYTSSSFSWTASPTNPSSYTVTGSDAATNTVGTSLSFTTDNLGPAGGALTVNSVPGTSGGATAFSNTGSYSGTFTNFSTDTGSGFASSVLTREIGTLSNGTCSAYGLPGTISSISESSVVSGCYRYTLTGTDKVGNTSVLITVVQVDRGAPTQALSLNPVTGGSYYASGTNTVYYRGNAAGSFTLGDAVTDGESGPNSAVFPAIATTGWTHNAQTVSSGSGSAPTTTYTSSTYSWTANPTNPTGVGRTVTGSDVAGNTVATSPTFTSDIVVPTGGALSVNSTAATTGGTSSITGGTSWTIGTRTDWTDAASGIASSTLTVQTATLTGSTCGSFGSATTIVGTPSQSGTSGNCYKYTLTGTDNVGNVATAISTTVQADAPPTVTNLQLVNKSGGAAGKIESGDQIVVTYSKAIDPATFCSGWDGTTDLAGNNASGMTVALANGVSGNDTITVTAGSSKCGGTFNFAAVGSIDLGSGAYTTANQSYGSNGSGQTHVTWNSTTFVLTITLGSGTTTPTTAVTSSIASYTPSTALLDLLGVQITGSKSTGNVQQF